MTTPILTSFDVACPHCGNPDATVQIDLNDLSACTCSTCDEEFSAEQARDLLAAKLAQWEAVCRWIALAPQAVTE